MHIFTTLTDISTETSCNLGILFCTSGSQEIRDAILSLPWNDLLALLTRG